MDDLFVGRDKELALLAATREEVGSGSPRVVSVEGAAGIGKTALLERFRVRLTGSSVIVATGEETEAALEFGVLSQLLQGFDVALPASLQPIAALRPAPGDPTMVGAGLVEALSDVQDRGPVALLVDDAQWADRGSLQALAFAFRRLEADRVLLLLSVRETVDALPGAMRRLLEGDRGRRIVLEGLPLREVVVLARDAGRPLRAHAARRLHANTGGNPLFVRASLAELETGALEASGAGPLPAPRAYARSILARLGHCSRDCRDLVEAAAVLGVRSRTDELFPVMGAPRPLAALDEAIGADVLAHHEALPGSEVRFTHPLIQATVYRSLPLRRRSLLHGRAAAVAKEELRAMHHAALSTQAPDAGLAARLERFAGRQMLTGSWIGAAEALVESARLSAERTERERRQLDAADCYLWVGDTAAAAHLLASASAGATPGAGHEYLQARLSEYGGRAPDADAHFQRAWERLEDGDEELATRIAGWYSMLLVESNRNAEAIRWSRRSLRDAGSSLLPLGLRRRSLCFALAVKGDTAEVLEITASLPERAADVPPDGIDLLLARGVARSWADRLPGARDDLAMTAELARRRGDALSLILALGNLADVEYRLGDWDAAVTHAELSASAAEDSDHLFFAPSSHAITAYAHAARGAWTEAERCVQAAELVVDAMGGITAPLGYTVAARARLELARRRPDLAARALERLTGPEADVEGLRNPGIIPWQLLHAEALHELGRHEEAASVLDVVEPRIRELGLRTLPVVVGRLRGQIEAGAGRPDRALAAFEDGLSVVPPELAPYEFARLEVAYGAFLRRQGRRRAARDRLESARDRLVALRADPELQRCEAELAGTGLKPVRRTADARNLLTSQEVAVARLVARGMKSREVATELFVSVKTIEYHLGNIYGKLGLTSRGQLVRHMLEPRNPSDLPSLT